LNPRPLGYEQADRDPSPSSLSRTIVLASVKPVVLSQLVAPYPASSCESWSQAWSRKPGRIDPDLIRAHAKLLGLMMDLDCEFCRIVRGEQPTRVVAEAPDALAFFPLRPVCLGHTIVIPKVHVRDLWAADSRPDTGLMQMVISVGHAIKAAVQPAGLNLISSAGEAASQTVFHLHLHVVPRWPGDRLGNLWPPSPPLSEEAKDETAAAIRAAYAVASAGSP
jgi:histidine triad (HIT) family protein